MERPEDGLVVLVPSRGRPHTVAELTEAFGATSACTTQSALVFVVDEGDPTLPEYRAEVDRLTDGWLSLTVVSGGTMVKALNEAAAEELTYPRPPYALGFMGDDHRPRTPGWDQRYLDALSTWAVAGEGPRRGVAMVYGDDTIQGRSLPTQIAMTTETVRRLGWMAPPCFEHMFVDNAWLALGLAAARITYLPDVVVEHVHPIKTGVWDEGHIRVNAGGVYARDGVEFQRWKLGTGRDDFGGAAARLMEG